jgi:hypothetical protein
MLQPWRLLGGYQFEERVDEVVVAERECWLLRGRSRIAEPLMDDLVARWARASDSGLMAIDKELGIALSITASFSERAWYRAELQDLSSQDLRKAEESTESVDEELDIVEAAEAVKRLQFTLYLPERVPRNSKMEIQVDTAGTWAGVSFETSDYQWPVLVHERPAEAAVEEDLDEWERWEESERNTWIWDQASDPAGPGRRWLVVRTERTHCSLYSSLPRSLLVEVARSLTPLA